MPFCYFGELQPKMKKFELKNSQPQMNVSKNRGKTPKMDGENNGKPYAQMDDLGPAPILGNTQIQAVLIQPICQCAHPDKIWVSCASLVCLIATAFIHLRSAENWIL